jgi:hypothetical protein
MSTGAAAAQPPGAVLTKAEYHDLTALQAAAKAALSGHHGPLRRAVTICRRAPGGSALLRANKAKCAALAYYAIGDLNVLSATRRCSKVKTLTVAQAFECLAPSFSALSGDAEILLQSARRAASTATARKFKSSCVAALGGSKQGLRLLGEFASDLKVLVASMKAENLGLFTVVIKRVDRIKGSIRTVKTPGLSVCPHL